MNPYLILGVTPQATDADIRAAYLDAVKQATPDTNPVRFQAVCTAYEKIKDPARRLEYLLFNQDCPGDSPLEAVVRCAQTRRPPVPLPMAAMKEYLRLWTKS